MKTVIVMLEEFCQLTGLSKTVVVEKAVTGV